MDKRYLRGFARTPAQKAADYRKRNSSGGTELLGLSFIALFGVGCFTVYDFVAKLPVTQQVMNAYRSAE